MNSELSLLTLIENNIKENSNVRISTKKISLRAFYRLINIFKKAKSIRILLTDFDDYKNIENEIIRSYEIDRKENELLTNEFELKLKNDLMDFYYAKEVREFIKNKIEIKYINKYNNNFISIDSNNFVITNVVEISMSTLGEIESDEDLIIEGHSSEKMHDKYALNFDQAWNSFERSKEIKEKLLNKLMLIYKEKSPYDLYHFSLSKILSKKNFNKEDQEEAKNREKFEQTKIFKSLYNFQVHAVEAIIEKINKYNGCILADSVGLGKTYEALAVIKYFEIQGKRALVLCPKKLRNNWINFKHNLLTNDLKEDNFNYTILSHTDLSREKGFSDEIELNKLDWSNFDLLVIDESHNFRNGKFNENTNKWRSKRYDKLMKEVILKGRKTSVLLLSATPVNNRMQDINSQIKLITRDDDFAFKNESIESIEKICNDAEKKSNEWSELPEKDRTIDMYQKMVGNNFRKLIDLMTIARSRKQIKENYLNETLNFPNRLKPISKRPNIDTKNEVGNIKDLNNQISNINFAFYKPINYVRPEFMSEYEEEYDWRVKNTNSRLSHKSRENNLVNLLKINILKRFESSVESFKITMKKILENTKNIKETLDRNSFLLPNIDDLYDDEGEFQEELDFKKIKVRIEHLDLIKYQDELSYDIEKIQKILNDFEKIDYERDEKLKQLIQIIESKTNNPINGENKKVIVFTTFIDTAKYLYKHISNYFENKNVYSLLVTGTECKTNNRKIENFNNLDMMKGYHFFLLNLKN